MKQISSADIHQEKAIAAIATPIGEGGISVIRVSGINAISLVNEIFIGKDLTQKKGYTVHFGKIVDVNGQIIDEVLATLFRSPYSYTGEDTVEISCHGGILISQAVLERVLAAGARSAEPGEFTRRAFLNGKLDLSQAEAVADLIHAKSGKAAKNAGKQLEGELGKHIQTFRQEIIDAAAMVELELDFIEEDVEFANKEELVSLLTKVNTEIDKLLATYESGRLIRDGVKTAFVGRPNAGKSTLLNALTGYDRAIVSSIAGTTRDTIDTEWSYEGIRFVLTDTAGLRETDDIIEAEGIKRSEKAIREADIIVFLHDSTQVFTDLERLEINKYRLLNKTVPFLLIGTKKALLSDQKSISANNRVEFDLQVSAAEDEGLDSLKKLLKQRAVEGKSLDDEGILVTSTRHRDVLEKAKSHINQALHGLEQGMTGDFISIDLRAALNTLGTLTGQITTEDLLGSIFSRFCIGK
jgi:tRNA modification GTPase